MPWSNSYERSLGCGVALDDFGTGYGSFTYLKHLPVTELKIDMSFIRGLVGNDLDQRVVQSIVMVAKTFEMETVAEGVEDEETLSLLQEWKWTSFRATTSADPNRSRGRGRAPR